MVSLADEVEVPSDEESTSSHGYVIETYLVLSSFKINIHTSVSRHTKDSSNDSDPYEDSSNNEGSFCRFAWGSDSEEARPSHKRKKSGSSQAEAFQGVDGSVSERSSNAETQDLEARKTPDELLLMEMSEEERIFYEDKKTPGKI